MFAQSDVLLLDLGNTHLHWRLGADAGVVDPATGLEHWPLEMARIQRVVWAAVGRAEALATLQTALGHVVWERCCRPDQSLLRTQYQPEQLGIDRWLAMLGALNRLEDREPPVILVDAGTALTLDLVLGQIHVGGWIMPGYYRWHDALYAGTAIPPAPESGSNCRLALATSAAIANGWQVAMVSAIEAQMRRHAGARLLLTGGDAWRLQDELPQAHLLPELVLDGLAIWADNR